MPPHVAARDLVALWRRYPHLHVFREYLERADAFLGKGAMPRCHAGRQSFNVDHLGNVAPCIEKSDGSYGNVKREPFADILARMHDLETVAKCQDCWTLCRGFSQVLGEGGSAGGWRDLVLRMRNR